MNIRQQFESLLNPKRRMTAKITGGKGANVWVAETPAGAVVVLTGQGQIGQHVYYNAYTLEIEGEAPVVTWAEIKV